MDVAAYFATREPPENARYGSIFMVKMSDVIRSGVARIVKLPEVYVRPNRQSALFLMIPESIDNAENLSGLHFQRLHFPHTSPELLKPLRDGVGDIFPNDEVAVLADKVKEGRVSEMRRIEPGLEELGLTILEDPAFPETPVLIPRFLELVGIVTDDGKAFLLLDICREIVSTSPTVIQRIIPTVNDLALMALTIWVI